MTIIDKIISFSPPNRPKSIFLPDLLDSIRSQKEIKLYVPFGLTWDEQKLWLDFKDLGSLLIAGDAGSGKTTFINSVLFTLIHKLHKNELKILLATTQPSHHEILNIKGDITSKTITDFDNLNLELKNVVDEMENRFKTLEKAYAMNIGEYNQKSNSSIKYIFFVIDNFSDLIKGSNKKTAKEIDESIITLLQLGKAVGIHILLATNHISEKVLSGVATATFINHLCFRTASAKDSEYIMACTGAEKLLGKGDAILSYFHDGGAIRRIQTPLI